MKKASYVLILSLVVVSGLVFANREIKNGAFKKSPPKQLTMKEWEATPAGIKYKEWEASPEGKKVYVGVAKISKYVREYTNMEAVVTSLSLPPASYLGFGVMVRINGEDYILRFDGDPQQLHSLKVNDKIIIKSHYVSVAPKYAYPIVSGEYVERDGKIIYKHAPRKGGC
jgi:hypothetical protein